MMLLRAAVCLQAWALAAFLAIPLQADEGIVLKYKLEKGATHITQIKNDNKITQSFNGMTLEIKMDQTAIDIREVKEITPEGAAKLTTKTERLANNVDMGVAGSFKFDSKSTERDKSSSLGASLTPLYERLVGSELQLEVTPRGVVTSFTGYSQLLGDILKDNPLATQFIGGGSDNAAKLGAQGHYLIFPDKAVKPGDKWENPFEMDLSGLGAFKGKETVTFLNVEERDGHQIAKFSTTSDASFDLSIDMGGNKVTGKISTSNSSGTAEFDITLGKLLKHSGELTLSGPLTVNANGMMIPVQISQTITVSQVALDKLPD